jgi:ferric-dicitrate binding protein FerR (iron transport regulator)
MTEFMNEDATPRPRKFRVVVPLVALVVLAVAGVAIWDGPRVDVEESTHAGVGERRSAGIPLPTVWRSSAPFDGRSGVPD